MRRTTSFCRGVVLMLIVLAGPPAALAATYSIDVSPDRKDGTYKVGEEVVFRITIREDGRPPIGKQVAYTITKDDGAQVAGGSIQTTARPALVKAKLDAPGILRCTITID